VEVEQQDEATQTRTATPKVHVINIPYSDPNEIEKLEKLVKHTLTSSEEVLAELARYRKGHPEFVEWKPKIKAFKRKIEQKAVKFKVVLQKIRSSERFDEEVPLVRSHTVNEFHGGLLKLAPGSHKKKSMKLISDLEIMPINKVKRGVNLSPKDYRSFNRAITINYGETTEKDEHDAIVSSTEEVIDP